MKTKLLLATFFAFTAAAVLAVAAHYQVISAPAAFLLATRWIAIGGLLGYAFARRSLTTWILVSMVIGAEIGHDWPGVAVNLRVLSLI